MDRVQIRHEGKLSVHVSKPLPGEHSSACGLYGQVRHAPLRHDATRGDSVWGQMAKSAELSWFLLCLLLPRGPAANPAQWLSEAHLDTPRVFQLSGQCCHPFHALLQRNNSWELIGEPYLSSVEDPGTTRGLHPGLGFTALSSPDRPGQARPRRRVQAALGVPWVNPEALRPGPAVAGLWGGPQGPAVEEP